MSSRQNGFFIVLEGCDLAGKTTQVQRLKDSLANCYGNDRVIDLAFPDYGSLTGQFISDFLHETVTISTPVNSKFYSALVFQCVHACDKFAWASRIQQSLEKGKIVITGRWIPSAVVYGKIDSLDTNWTEDIYSFLPKPDLNILLDVNPERVQSRLKMRGQTADSFDRNLTKQKQIAAYYMAYWGEKMRESSSLRWRIVNAEGGIDEVAAAILREVIPSHPL